jgi:hypothetical protein
LRIELLYCLSLSRANAIWSLFFLSGFVSGSETKRRTICYGGSIGIFDEWKYDFFSLVLIVFLKLIRMHGPGWLHCICFFFFVWTDLNPCPVMTLIFGNHWAVAGTKTDDWQGGPAEKNCYIGCFIMGLSSSHKLHYYGERKLNFIFIWCKSS